MASVACAELSNSDAKSEVNNVKADEVPENGNNVNTQYNLNNSSVAEGNPNKISCEDYDLSVNSITNQTGKITDNTMSEAIFQEDSENNKDEAKHGSSGEISDSQDNSNVEEDDVPPNFFDDLMNEDFIEGLNVVDAWDEDDSGKSNDLRKKLDIRRDLRKRIRNNKSPIKLRSRDRSRERRARRNRSFERKSFEKTHEEDARRDPNKTNRDILRDKDKRAKDKKAKIISERLKVVETGLVPPGMEMEVDLNITKQSDKSKKKEHESKISRSKSNRKSPSLPRYRRSPSRGSRERYSIERRYKRSSRSPRRYSPKHIRNRSIERKRDDRIYDGRRRRIDSPPRGRRGRSSSDVSVREKWLRRRNDNREDSPVKRKVQSFLQELNDKLAQKSINDVQNKLDMNVMHCNMQQPLNMQGNYMPGPVPPPMPVPNPNFQNTLVQQKYDQQFFIGQPDMGMPNNFSQPIGQHNFMQQDMCPSHMLPQHQQQMPFMMQPNPQPVPTPMSHMPINPQLSVGAKLIVAKHNKNEKEVFMQLFADKKISLSDYLSLTAKYTDNTKPIDIQNKIRVITRAQDAIKELTGEGKFSGRFIVKKTMRSFEKPVETRNLSPFKRIPVVRFQFTTLSKQDDKLALSNNLNRLLVSIGLDPIFNLTPKPSPVPQEVNKNPEVNLQEDHHTKRVNKFIQTDVFKCEECASRCNRKMGDVTTQTGNVLSFDIACQVSPKDFERPVRSILKGQSLASMTPAQLLAQTNRSPSPSFSPPSNPRTPSPVGLPSKKSRMDINDQFMSDRDYAVNPYAQRNLDNEHFANRYRSANDFDIGNFERYGTSDQNRSPFKTPPFSNFSSRLNYVATSFQNQKPRGPAPSFIGGHRPSFEPPHPPHENNPMFMPPRRY